MPGTEIAAINNAAYGIQQNNEALRNMASSVSGRESASQLRLLQEKEKQLMLDNQRKELEYKARVKMEESRKKMEKEKQKRKFHAFA